MRKIESLTRNYRDSANFSDTDNADMNRENSENKGTFASDLSDAYSTDFARFAQKGDAIFRGSDEEKRDDFSENGIKTEKLALTISQKRLGAAALRCLSHETTARKDWIQDRISRMDFLLDEFGGRNLPRGAHDAAYIYEATSALDFSSEQTPPENLAARKNLLENYLTNPELSNREAKFVLAILGDLSYLDNEANMYRANPNIYQSGAPNPHLREIIRDDYAAKISHEDWAAEAQNLDFERIGQVLEQVNLESVVIKSLQLLDDLLKSNEHSDVEIFHKINEAEYFYAPIAEVVGFDGMAAALRDKAAQIRLMKLGADEVLEKAWAQFREAEKFDIREILRMISPADEPLYEKIAGSSRDKKESVNFGDVLIDLGSSDSVFGTYRYKTVGSIAKKMLKKESYRETLPHDLIGLTFVFPDVKNLRESLLKIIENLENQVNFKAAPGKDSAFFVQATEENLNKLVFEMAESGHEPAFKIVKDWDFQVAKFTFSPKNQPNVNIEIQFLTKEHQKSGRVGESAHILYKLNREKTVEDRENIERQLAIMQKINARRDWIGQPKTKSESLERAERLVGLWLG